MTGERRAAAVAMVSAALIIAQQVASKATRDVLFLSSYEATELPRVMLVSAAAALVSALALSPLFARFGPHRLVPALFLASAAAYCVEAALQTTHPGLIAYVMFLHVAIFGAAVVSGFWSVVNERFDPHAARRLIGRIAAGAACGGVIGGILAERVTAGFGAGKVLVALAVLHVMAAIGVTAIGAASRPPTGSTSGAFVTLAKSAYLRRIAWTVVLLAFAGALLDYVLKAEADARVAGEERLARFFAAYYTGVGLLTFALQSTVTKQLLARVGIGRTIAIMPVALMALSVLGAAVTRLWSVVLLRGVSSVLESSVFRSGYELLYTPVARHRKRPTKLLIDVAGTRLGDALGSGAVLLLLMLVPATTTTVSLGLAAVAAAGALVLVSHLQRGYVAELAQRLRTGSFVLEDPDALDATTRATIETTLGFRSALAAFGSDARIDSLEMPTTGRPSLPPPEEEDLPDMLARLAGPDWQRTARALQKSARKHVGQLIDALLDDKLPVVLRGRIPRIIARVSKPRVVAGLLEALEDRRFEIRYRAGAALSSLLVRHPELRPPRAVAFELATREVKVGRTVWESQARLGDEDFRDSAPADAETTPGDAAEEPPKSKPGLEDEGVGALLRKRRDRSLEHVFNLLSLTFDRDTLRIALQALASGDRTLEGTALEYLENILPDEIRDGLWPYIAPDGRAPRRRRPASEIVDELLTSMNSLRLDREELLQRMSEDTEEP